VDFTLLAASQIIIQVVVWPVVILLGVASVRRRAAAPRLWIPALGSAVLLAVTAVIAFPTADPVPTVLTGAAWFAVFPLIMSTYPDGFFVPRWTAIVTVGWAGLAVAYLASNGSVADQTWWAPLAFTNVLLVLPQAYRYRRRATTAERESARWAILATVLAFAGFVIILLVEGGTVAEHGPLSVATANLLGLIIPVGLAVGLLRPRTLDVDAALRWCVIVLGTGALLAPMFWGAGHLIAEAGGTDSPAAWWAAGLVAALTVPAVRAATRVADRFLFGARPEPDAAVRELAARLAGHADPDAVTATIAGLVGDALALDQVELSGLGLPTVTIGSRPEAPRSVPIVYQGEVIGTITVGPRRGESDLTRRDLTVLRQLAAFAAPALHGARAVSQLMEARARSVLAREEERKSLRRDLHDDLAPTLAGMGMSAAAISALARSGDPGTIAVADDLLADIRAAIGQTRELAYGLRPPILDDLGLVAAIRHRLRVAFPGSVPQVTVVAPDGRLPLPAAVELAALRIVQEAVSNVRRHASAQTCLVTVRRGPGDLRIEVADDGVGIPTAPPAGLGLSSIRGRAEELGGTARIERRPDGGTLVAVRLPVGPEPASGVSVA
jgi:signal transduction histidine kinase